MDKRLVIAGVTGGSLLAFLITVFSFMNAAPWASKIELDQVKIDVKRIETRQNELATKDDVTVVKDLVKEVKEDLKELKRSRK